MKVWFSYTKEGGPPGVFRQEVEAMDISTKRYRIRVRMSGIMIIRKANPKVGRMEDEVRMDKYLNLV